MIDNNGFQQKNDISEIKDQLQRLSVAHEQTIQKQNELIGKLHECIVKYGNDVLFKSQKDLIEEMIQLADQVHYSILDQKKEQNYQLLLDSMVQIGQWIEASLSRVKVRRFDSGEHRFREFDAKKQEVIDTVETNNSSEDGFYKSELPGYVWTIPFVGSVESMLSEGAPQKFEFVFRPEQVVSLKYRPIKVELQMQKPVESYLESEPSVSSQKSSETSSCVPSDKEERKFSFEQWLLSLLLKKIF